MLPVCSESLSTSIGSPGDNPSGIQCGRSTGTDGNPPDSADTYRTVNTDHVLFIQMNRPILTLKSSSDPEFHPSLLDLAEERLLRRLCHSADPPRTCLEESKPPYDATSLSFTLLLINLE
jgi:hypothetical protein